MLVRMILCVVLSYLWQQCVIHTETKVGVTFPKRQCQAELDCFASEVHFMTLLRRSYKAVDCRGPKDDFAKQSVVTCIGIIKPDVPSILLHVGITHSLTQLNLKFYGLLVWVAGNSKWLNRLFGILALTTFSVVMGIFCSGAFSEFSSSWLSFVTTLSVPGFLFNVNRSAKLLDRLRRAEAEKMQYSIDQHLSTALADMERDSGLQKEECTEGNKTGQTKDVGRVRGAMQSARTRTLGAVTGIASMFPLRSSSTNTVESGGEAAAARAAEVGPSSGEDHVPDKQ